jgi:tRNA(His) 5'-end guanylyltransferase
MRHPDLDTRMRAFEAALDAAVPLGFQIVVRLDGRGFTRLTKDICAFETPFDARFRDLMITTSQHLMDAGFRVCFAYSESDEISLAIHPDEDAFGRKPRKWISILAGEASAAFSVALGQPAAFDARLSVLPGAEQVLDYFRWRMNDAARCCLNGHAYWLLREEGLSARAASERLLGMSRAAKHDLLFAHGINFDALPTWQKRGFGLYWDERRVSGIDPRTGEEREATRRVLKVDLDLPWKEAFEAKLRQWLSSQAPNKDQG